MVIPIDPFTAITVSGRWCVCVCVQRAHGPAYKEMANTCVAAATVATTAAALATTTAVHRTAALTHAHFNSRCVFLPVSGSTATRWGYNLLHRMLVDCVRACVRARPMWRNTSAADGTRGNAVRLFKPSSRTAGNPGSQRAVRSWWRVYTGIGYRL